MNKRGIFTTIAILAVVLASLPFFIGLLVEHQIKQLAAQMAESSRFDIEVQKYRRGWLHSQVLFVITPQNEEFQQAYQQMQSRAGASQTYPLQFILVERVTHGPILFLGADNTEKLSIQFGRALLRGRLQLQDKQAVAQKSHTNQQVFLDGRSLISLGGNYDFLVRSQSLSLQDLNQVMTVKLNNLLLHWHVSRNIYKIAGTSSLAGLNLLLPGNIRVEMSDWQLQGSFQKNEDKLWLGDWETNLPFLTIAVNGKNRFLAKDLEIKAGSEISGNVVDSIYDASLDKVIANQLTYGPGNFRIALNNMHAQSLLVLRQIITELHHLTLVEQHKSKSLKQDVLALLPDLLSQGFQLQLNPMYLQTPDGEANLQAWLTFPNLHQRAEATLTELIKQSDGSLTVSVPKTLFEKAITSRLGDKANQQISDWVEKKWVLVDAGIYSFSLVYKNEKIYINGKPYQTEAKQPSAQLLMNTLPLIS